MANEPHGTGTCIACLRARVESGWNGNYRCVPSAVELARFRRRELLRILLRDVLGREATLNVTEELSNLADAILHVCYERIRNISAHTTAAPDGGREARFR